MNDLDKYLDIINIEKEKLGLTNYTPLYPMLRIENDKLYIGIMLTKNDANVWDATSNIKPDYWALIDIESNNIISFNKTEEVDFVIGSVIPKNNLNKTKEISKYTVEKTLEYQNYLIEDIKNEKLPIQKKLSNILGEYLEIDGEKVNINDYLLSNLEEEIKTKIKDLVELLIHSKYSSITFYYDRLFNDIIKEYKDNNNIDRKKLELCLEIMNNYYDGIVYIDNFFNI